MRRLRQWEGNKLSVGLNVNRIWIKPRVDFEVPSGRAFPAKDIAVVLDGERE